MLIEAHEEFMKIYDEEDIKGIAIYLNKAIVLKLIIGLLSLVYIYLATLPKHGDFWGLNYQAKIFAITSFDVYGTMAREMNIPIIVAMHPPAFFMMQSMWIKLGSFIYGYDLHTWTLDGNTWPRFLQLWLMATYLIALFALALIAYFTLKNKWLCVFCYGPFAFISVIIMGQTDIFCALLIYCSLLLFLEAFKRENFISFLVASGIILGLSINFKTYGLMIFPIYLIFSFLIIKSKSSSDIKNYLMMLYVVIAFLISSFVVWIPYRGYFGTLMLNGESSWLLNLQVAPVNLPPNHTVSLWLLGYIIIIALLLYKATSQPSQVLKDKRYFIFYIFCVISWFFMTVYTHPQWWVILMPPILLVVDNFEDDINYFYLVLIQALFIFYPMIWIGNIDTYLESYMPVIPIMGNNIIILITLLVSLLAIWIIGLNRELNEVHNEEPRKLALLSRKDIALSAIIICIIAISAIAAFGSTELEMLSQATTNQPVGEIYGTISAGETFISPNSNMNAIEVCLATYQRLNTNDIVFHLRNSTTSLDDITTIKVNARIIEDNQFHKFKFAPIKDSKGRAYYFYIDSPQSAPGNAITIWYNTNDVYKGGSAFINKAMIDGDLAFRVYYKP